MLKPGLHIARLGIVSCIAALSLYTLPILRPMILYDDFTILVHSLSWRAACDSLWLPQNEHAMPLGRLSTWALLQLAARPTAYPSVIALQGPAALLFAMVLLYLFVRRELGESFYGLMAMVVFGVTSIYLQAVGWFAASFSVLALDMMVLALLAAQRWRQTYRFWYLPTCLLWTGLAPCWYASGILAGPLCCLYLLPRAKSGKVVEGTDRNGWLSSCLRFSLCLSPLLGTATFLAVSLPRTAAPIMHSVHYGGRTAVEAFDPFVGLVFTCKSLVDNLALGQLGISSVTMPGFLVPWFVALITLAVIGWWRPVAERRLLYLGTGFILLSYLLVYSARATWSYDDYMTNPSWGRYHLLPQLGLTLLICGGLPHRRARLTAELPDEVRSRSETRTILVLIVVLFMIQIPRGLLASVRYDWGQHLVLLRVAEMDARCRAHQIDAATARAALGMWRMPGCGETENGWDLLRGSENPRPMSVEHARQLLDPSASLRRD